jgi:hypothetical protein
MSLNNMRNRLNFHGGADQQKRMNEDKLRSLKKALLYSYQAATAVLSDGRTFKCLINPNKLSLDLDNKILSIPFKGICLNNSQRSKPEEEEDNNNNNNNSNNSGNEEFWEDMEDLVSVLVLSSEGTWEDMGDPESPPEEPEEPDEPIIPSNSDEEIIGIKEGDVFEWKENGSHWLVYLRRLEETAYFRADIRRCRYELTLGNGSKYWAYVRGPVEQSILWSQTSGNYYNKLNYTLVMYIPQTEESLKYFSRFKKVIINNQPWEVQAVDSISTPGIIEMTLKETYNNSIEKDINKIIEEIEKKEEIPEKEEIFIYGPKTLYPYDVSTYEIKNYNGIAGTWSIENASRSKMVKMFSLEDNKIQLSILTGKSGKFTLVYKTEKEIISSLDITIGSL